MRTLPKAALGALLSLSASCSLTLDPDGVELAPGDTSKPVLSITSKPPSPIMSADATFVFTATDDGSPVTLLCQLDDNASAPCANSVAYSGLAAGDHTFTLTGTDAAGNQSTSSWSWTVTSTPNSGNGVREGLEGCDDGNRESLDGCSSDCVYELDGRPSFAAVSYNGLWMAVTPSGTIYMSVIGSGGSADEITRVDVDGSVHEDAIPGIRSCYGGDVIAVGEDLVFGGSSGSPYATYIQRWTSSSGTSQTLFELGSAYFYHFAVNASVDRMFYADYGGPIYKVTGTNTSAAFASESVQRLFYDQAADRLYVMAGGTLKVDSTGGAGATGSFSSIYTNVGMRDIAIDGEGTLYLTCSVDSAPCTPGAVIAVDPSGSPSRPFISSSTAIRRIGYDAAANQLVVVVAGNIHRVPLAR